MASDEERSAPAGQNDIQAQDAAETDGGNAVVPQDVTPVVATEITPQSPVQTDTRRTSMSSRGGENMQASQPSLQSGSGEAGERQQGERQQRSAERDGQRRRQQQQQQVSRLDYGSIRSDTNTPTGSRQHLSAPQTPRRPGQPKRMPSSAAPHRGEVFSVDDDAEEVGEDLRLAKTISRQDRDRERERERERQLRRRESTIRRRPAAAQPPNLHTVESSEGDEEHAHTTGNDAAATAAKDATGDPSSEETLAGDEEEEESEETPNPDSDDADLSDAESFTLKDRQQAINETHPFGIRIWKPAIYKKNRSVQRNAEGDIHSAPGGNVSRWLFVFNCLWTIIFGWWLAIVAAAGGILCMILSIFQFPGCYDYGRVLINLSHYIFYPFGKYVKLERDEAYMDEDEGEGRSISEYERWQTGDLEEGRLFFGPTDINRSLIGRRREEVEDIPNETDSLLGRQRRQSTQSESEARKTKNRLFGRGKWDVGRVIFFLSFYVLIVPCMFIVSMVCWFFVFTIPMGKVTLLLLYHLRRHPLALSFHTDRGFGRTNSVERGASGSSILLCTYRAVGTKYWKYTIDGQNIFLINLLGLVVFVIFDYFVLYETLGIESWLTSLGFVFLLALASIIPLAYFIGQAVASISAQSSMGVGATINAFFSTVVEVFLYCIALKEGKAALVEGSIIGSIFAGILFLPGLSMCFGAIKRKTQRFNVKSAGVTSTMLLFAVIGAFGPTLFYQIYGSHELQCHECVEDDFNGRLGEGRDCRRCFFNQSPAVHDAFYIRAVRPYIWFAAVALFLSYVVGLLFTLRTHAAVIWNNESDEKKELKGEQHQAHRGGDHMASVPGTAGLVEDPRSHMTRQGTASSSMLVSRENIKDSQMYKRILNQSLKQAGVVPQTQKGDANGPFIVPPKAPEGEALGPVKARISGLSVEDNRELVQEIAELAASAATIAARDATKAPRRASVMASTSGSLPQTKPSASASSKDAKSGDRIVHSTSQLEPGSLGDFDLPTEGPNAPAPTAQAAEQPSGGHDAPNWSRAKSAIILLTATVAYAIIAEILVDTVDAVLSTIDIDQKFLGITLFALVPNTTEFLNAISFAMNGNVALSMEIGSSYALQVILLQIPALVLFSAIYLNFIGQDEVVDHTFSLIFPQWDMVTIILSVFLMGWIVGEGKSNYFKGSILIFSYLTIGVGFWFSGYVDMDTMGVDRFDTLALNERSMAQSFKTIGRSKRGIAY